jgi:hypothetical protein
MGSVSGFGGGLADVMSPPASLRIAIPAATSLWCTSEHRIPGRETERNLPLPASTFPPDVKGSRCYVGKIERRTVDIKLIINQPTTLFLLRISKTVSGTKKYEPSQTPYAMNHASLSPTPSNLSRHIHKTIYLPPHISPLRIPPILSPLTAKNTTFRRLFR